MSMIWQIWSEKAAHERVLTRHPFFRFCVSLCNIAHTISEVRTLGKQPEQRKARLKKTNASTFVDRTKQGIAPEKTKKG